MKKGIFLFVLLLLVVSCFAQARIKTGTLNLGGEYGIGDNGHMDVRFSGRFNIQHNFILGAYFQYGIIDHDTDELIYTDPEDLIMYTTVEDWNATSYGFELGYEFKPYEKINPWVTVGVGFWKFGAIAKEPGYSDVELESEDTGMKIPFTVGVDFVAGNNFIITPYARYIMYSDDMEMTIYDYMNDTYYNEDIAEWRGSVALGVTIGWQFFRAPGHLDDDGDGVWNKYDRCPDTPKGTRVNERGCKIQKVEVKQNIEDEFNKGLFVTNEIYFDFNSETIKEDSYPMLDAIGRILEKNKWQVEISGHTDSIGTAGYNQKLSEKRAKSVKNYLVDKYKIIPDHLKWVGFGESMPIADNGTAEGRAKNRRVEFKVIKD